MLFFNHDCTDFAYTQALTGDDGGRIDRYIDRILDGGVTHFLCNTQAERTNYASAVWEPFWTGYDPDGPDDQPYLVGIGAAGAPAIKHWRHLVGNMLALHRQGIDYPGRVLARCRQRGVAAWISLRMNDVHVQDNEAHPIHSAFWRDHPCFRRQGYTGYYAKALDYAHPDVRDHYRALIVETLERYDIEGLELDFMREPYLFSLGEEDTGRAVLTDWLRTIRSLVLAASERRGHPIQLGVRVPSRPAVCARFGLEPVAWAGEGLIDVLVPTPRWASLEFDIPIAEWQRLLAGTGVTLAGGLEVLYRPFRNAAQHGVTSAQARGAAAQFLADGADGIYLFNYFPSGQAAGEAWWSAEDYAEVLRALTDLSTLRRQSRSYALTCHDVHAPDGREGETDPLPARGDRLQFALPSGPSPEGPAPARLTIDIEQPVDGAAEPPVVCVNGGVPLVLRQQAPVAADQREYPVPHGYLHCEYTLMSDCLKAQGSNTIDLSTKHGESILVLAVQVHLAGSR